MRTCMPQEDLSLLCVLGGKATLLGRELFQLCFRRHVGFHAVDNFQRAIADVVQLCKGHCNHAGKRCGA